MRFNIYISIYYLKIAKKYNLVKNIDSLKNKTFYKQIYIYYFISKFSYNLYIFIEIYCFEFEY